MQIFQKAQKNIFSSLNQLKSSSWASESKLQALHSASKKFNLEDMNDDEYSLNRNVSDFFDEALGLGLAEDIKLSQKDRYLTGKEIARGGMKSIEITVDTLTGREVAKALLIAKDDPEKTERFFHEARICASLEHPNIVPVYDTGFDKNGLPFFTMRLLGGQTLQKKVTKTESSVADLIDVYVKICDAVSYAHSQGILHRDLKPDNIQIGDFGEVQVCDWGLACEHGYKHSSEKDKEETKEFFLPVTLDGMIKGTPGYLAPEQAQPTKQELTATADIYSLGAILYFILSGKAPLEECDTLQSIRKTIAGEITPIKVFNPNVSHSLNAICRKAMAVETADRYQSVEELKNDILKYQHGFPTAAEEAGPWSSLKLFIKRNQRISILIAIFFVVFNSALFLFLINLSAKEKQAREAETIANQAAEQALKSEVSATQAAEQARLSEQETLEAMAMLAASEQQARETLENLQRMTAEKNQVSHKAAPRFLRLGRMSLSEFKFSQSLEELNQALALQSDIPLGKFTKAKILTALLRFEEAEQYFLRAETKRNDFLNIVKEMKKEISSPSEATYEKIVKMFHLYKKQNMAMLHVDELIYSPALHFLTQEQRRQLALELGILFHAQKEMPFEKFKPIIEKKMPQVLYKTGVTSFNLRKFKKIKTKMIVGENTQSVIMPEMISPKLVLENLSLCPNIKTIYISPQTDPQTFESIDVQILNYKDIP